MFSFDKPNLWVINFQFTYCIIHCWVVRHHYLFQAMKFFLKNFFYEQPAYREEVLSTFSLLDSSLPELQFLNVDILTNLLRITTVPHGPLSVPGGKSTGNEQDGQASSLLVEKKVHTCVDLNTTVLWSCVCTVRTSSLYFTGLDQLL